MNQWYLLTYDVRDDKRLRKVARTLEGYGTRLQYSVFHCHLSRTDLEKLRWQLTRILEPEDDLLVIGLCSNCVSRLRRLNDPAAWPDERTGPIIV